MSDKDDAIDALLQMLTNGTPVDTIQVPEEIWIAMLHDINHDLAVSCSAELGPMVRFESVEVNGEQLTAVHMQGGAPPFVCSTEILNAFLIGMASTIRLMKAKAADA
jgi:hypothetical protein